jgi:hypothetical protein
LANLAAINTFQFLE